MPQTFAQYIETCKTQVQKARARSYQGKKLEQVVQMSIPFELLPTTTAPKVTNNKKYKKGILLTHGFLSSPYLMRSLAESFAQVGFLVRAVLLPGHGTYFQDLDNHTWKDWQATVRFGYDTLVQDCEEVYLCGFSIGATLSLILALDELKNKQSPLKKLILLAPCFGITPFAASFPFLVRTKLDRFLPQLFCTQAEQEHLASYKKFSLYSVSQIVLMLRKLRTKLKTYQSQKIPLPIYLTASHEDATVKFAPILAFAKHYLNTHSYVRIYSNNNTTLPKDVPGTLIRANQLNPNILAISHVALPVAPQDKYFGLNGSYYGVLPADTHFGEPRHLNHKIKRLTYNPDYAVLEQQICNWTNENDYHLQQK